MNSDFAEFDFKSQNGLEVDIMPPEEWMLANLGIDLAAPEFRELPPYKRAQYRAVKNWLTMYKPKPDAFNLEKVKGYLETFHHLCELEEWERAGKILLTRLNTPTKEQLHNHLNTWGYYQEQANIYDRLLEKFNEKFNNRNFIWDSNWLELGSFINIILTGLGNSYLGIGEYEKAIEYYQQRLTLARNTRDPKGEAWALANIALAYKGMSNYNEAINCLQHSLEIVKKIGDRQGEAACLRNLGLVYKDICDYDEAIKYLQESLEISEDISDSHGQGGTLIGLANIYTVLGKYFEATDHLKESLKIARKIGYRQLEGTAMGNLGNIYYDRGDFFKALEYHEQHLTITEEIGDIHGKANAMEGLSNVSFSQGNYAQSIDYRQQQLMMAKRIGDRKGEGNAFGGLGIAYSCQGEYDRAIKSHQQHLVIAEEIGYLSGQATALCNLGCGLFQLEQYSEAKLYLCRALKISQKIGDRSGEAYAFRNLVAVYQKLGNSLLAHECCDRALYIATELDIPLAKECQELKEKLLSEQTEKVTYTTSPLVYVVFTDEDPTIESLDELTFLRRLLNSLNS